MNEVIFLVFGRKFPNVTSAKELFGRLPIADKVWLQARANRKLLYLLNNGVINVSDEGHVFFERDLTPCLTRFLEENWSLAFVSDMEEKFVGEN